MLLILSGYFPYTQVPSPQPSGASGTLLELIREIRSCTLVREFCAAILQLIEWAVDFYVVALVVCSLYNALLCIIPPCNLFKSSAFHIYERWQRRAPSMHTGPRCTRAQPPGGLPRGSGCSQALAFAIDLAAQLPLRWGGESELQCAALAARSFSAAFVALWQLGLRGCIALRLLADNSGPP